jgi:hypothetical protein
MPTIGDTLREARMRQKLDITEIEARTKIRAKYLRALENEEWGALPGSTFVKTFLRTYAEALGLDAHLLVEEYRAHHEAPTELEMQPLGPPPAGRDGPRGRRNLPGPPGPGVLLTVVVVAVLAFLVVLGLSGEDDGGGEEASTTPAQTRPGKQRRPRQQAPRQVALRIAPQGDTYVCVDRGPETEPVFEGTIIEPRTFRGRRLRVNLGRRAVEVTANGKPVTIEPSPEPIGFEFTPARTVELPVGERPCAT